MLSALNFNLSQVGILETEGNGVEGERKRDGERNGEEGEIEEKREGERRGKEGRSGEGREREREREVGKRRERERGGGGGQTDRQRLPEKTVQTACSTKSFEPLNTRSKTYDRENDVQSTTDQKALSIYRSILIQKLEQLRYTQTLTNILVLGIQKKRENRKAIHCYFADNGDTF